MILLQVAMTGVTDSEVFDSATGDGPFALIANQAIALTESGAVGDTLSTLIQFLRVDNRIGRNTAQTLGPLLTHDRVAGGEALHKDIGGVAIDVATATEAVRLLLSLVLADRSSAAEAVPRGMTVGSLCHRREVLAYSRDWLVQPCGSLPITGNPLSTK